jgi:hypothetical protein
VEQHVVPTGCGYLAGPLGLNLTYDVRQIETAARVLADRLADHVDGLNGRHRTPSRKATNWVIEANTKDLDPFDQLGLPGLVLDLQLAAIAEAANDSTPQV